MEEATYVEGFHDAEAVKLMTYNNLGNTGLRVSEMAFGGGPAGGVYGSQMEEESLKTLQLALKCGINYIDTAPWYGNGRSEEVLGKGLATVPRQAFYIGTKVGRYEPNIENMFDFSAEKVTKVFEESLKKLGLDYVDIIQIHDIEFASSLDIIVNETLPALQKLVDQGKARFIGITGYTLSCLKEVVERSKVRVDTVLTYCRNTILNDDFKNYVDFFKSHNVSMINACCVVMGLLAQDAKATPHWHPAPQEIKDKVQEARDLCKTNGCDLGRLSVQYSLQTCKGFIGTHLMGNSSVAVLQHNIATIRAKPTDLEMRIAKQVRELFSSLSKTHWEGEDPKRYWTQLKMHRGEIPHDPNFKPFITSAN
ncbi:unnamed protein product [Meganyctiphanes norvegica]|uniref:NADP-dependent oxidoreductase domain-containing protein n=1 Tax=Meganyctiphanes norvegica TaxID=48144 RepID=A0AAV2PJQ1_MEGNR